MGDDASPGPAAADSEEPALADPLPSDHKSWRRQKSSEPKPSQDHLASCHRLPDSQDVPTSFQTLVITRSSEATAVLQVALCPLLAPSWVDSSSSCRIITVVAHAILGRLEAFLPCGTLSVLPVSFVKIKVVLGKLEEL